MRGPDPKDFEPEFAIGDDEGSSRSGTPRPGTENGTPATDGAKEHNETAAESSEVNDTAPTQKIQATAAASVPSSESADNDANQFPSEAPAEIRAKLRRLDKLESKYQGTAIVVLTKKGQAME